jgi:membrane protease YdiL (CAAX protease family)
MGRIIGGVVLGYAVMALAVMATFTIAYFVLGAERSFQPGSYRVSSAWLVVSTILSAVAAVAGGWVALAFGRTHRTAVILAIVVVVAGVVLALPTLNAPVSDEARTGEVSNTEAMMKAQQPPVVTILNPIIGGIGVMLGARLRKPD